MEKSKPLPCICIEYSITQRQPTTMRPNGSFIVSLRLNNQPIYVGVYVSLDVARMARNAKMRELGIKARSSVAGAEHLPDDLKLPAPDVKKAAIPKDVKAGYPIESKTDKFERQQAARKEQAVIDSMRDDTVARTYRPSLYRDDGKDYTPVYRHRSMA